jgi:hypothetical protein
MQGLGKRGKGGKDVFFKINVGLPLDCLEFGVWSCRGGRTWKPSQLISKNVKPILEMGTYKVRDGRARSVRSDIEIRVLQRGFAR